MERISDGMEASIGYLDGKFRVCRENCPVPTPKEIDDTVPMAVLVSEMMKKSKPVEPTLPTAEQVAQNEVPKEESPTSTAQQYEIHFDFGMSRPNAAGESELLRFEEGIRDQKNLKIELVGRTDDIGTSKFNRRLARKRALNIAAWIKSRGIKARIQLSTKAECCRAAPYDKRESSFKEKRRVTIISRQTGEGQMDK
jgi:outer membrane protein OmpA-like peptidoglycan-associated protein